MRHLLLIITVQQPSLSTSKGLRSQKTSNWKRNLSFRKPKTTLNSNPSSPIIAVRIRILPKDLQPLLLTRIRQASLRTSNNIFNPLMLLIYFQLIVHGRISRVSTQQTIVNQCHPTSNRLFFLIRTFSRSSKTPRWSTTPLIEVSLPKQAKCRYSALTSTVS